MNHRRVAKKPVIAFGPKLPDWGSWNWIGADLMAALSKTYRTVSFKGLAVAECDVAVIVKHAFPEKALAELADRAAVIYCPVDYYGSAAEIDSDGLALARCACIIVHAPSLVRYFEPYARVEYCDHHVKFASPLRQRRRCRGFVLWVGARSNLPPLIDFVNTHPLPGELIILTNPEQPGIMPEPCVLGFRPDREVSMLEWSAARHIELTRKAWLALDIKGSDFRSRHKPPAKAIDFIASGVPLAMNPDSCVVEQVSTMGFQITSALDPDRWLSQSYWTETQLFGQTLRDLISMKRVARRFQELVDGILSQRSLTPRFPSNLR
jgi:hypothetical protein